MSRAKRILAKVLESVSEETEIAPEKILSRCSESEVVDARWICVKLLSRQGIYTMKIAELMGITPRYVQYILTDFEDRLAVCEMMRINYEYCEKRVRTAGE